MNIFHRNSKMLKTTPSIVLYDNTPNKIRKYVENFEISINL